MKPKCTLVLIANEHEARILENHGPGRGLEELETLARAKQTRYADTTGRSRAGPGMARHGLDRSTTEREHDRDRFAEDVAEMARARWAQGGYDRAVLAAPPKMLGVLRRILDPALSAAMSGELNKDLLKVAPIDLPAHFNDVIIF